MVILYLLGIMGAVGIIATIVYLCTHDYTVDEKGKDKKEDIDDFILKP